jgi:hypothetical protein
MVNNLLLVEEGRISFKLLKELAILSMATNAR